jgi:chromosomal replication initiator protein
LQRLERELSAQDFNTWIRPLQVRQEGEVLYLLAPNRFVLSWIKEHFWRKIVEIMHTASGGGARPDVRLQVGSNKHSAQAPQGAKRQQQSVAPAAEMSAKYGGSPLNPQFTFNQFITGQSNQVAMAASLHVAEQGGYSPLYIYGGVGLGKTHLMQAVGNMVQARKPDAKIVYLHSERFVANMVKALQNKTINDFKKFYRSADVLLMDDVQFLSGKNQSQEEFLHTFDTLKEKQGQLIFTCDRTPRELANMEDRLKSRLGSGLTTCIEVPDLDTRVAILLNKAEQAHTRLSQEVAMFVAQHVDTSIRELEGALHRLLASARFMQADITPTFAQEVLKDLLAVRNKDVSIGDIQQAVAEYFGLSIDELNSKRRHRYIVRPRHIAISLCKELTPLSPVEIGTAFGGRDRTTVLHSCKTAESLKTSDSQIRQDYVTLLKILSQ